MRTSTSDGTEDISEVDGRNSLLTPLEMDYGSPLNDSQIFRHTQNIAPIDLQSHNNQEIQCGNIVSQMGCSVMI